MAFFTEYLEVVEVPFLTDTHHDIVQLCTKIWKGLTYIHIDPTKSHPCTAVYTACQNGHAESKYLADYIDVLGAGTNYSENLWNFTITRMMVQRMASKLRSVGSTNCTV